MKRGQQGLDSGDALLKHYFKAHVREGQPPVSFYICFNSLLNLFLSGPYSRD